MIERIVLGEARALRELYDLLAPRAFAIALRVLADPCEAEEVLQDTFVEIWRGAARFNPTRATADRWVVMLIRSRAIDRLRKRQVRDRMLSAAAEAPFAGRLSTEELVSTSQTRTLVRKALTQLPANQRSALELAYFEGLSQSEIAITTSTPLGTVKTRMRTGMIRLAEALS